MADRKKSKKYIIFILILIAAAAYYGYGKYVAYKMMEAMMAQQMAAQPVGVAEVIEKEVRSWKEFSGRLVAVERVEVRPQVSGTIESVNFSDGAMVKKGDLLFVIDPRPYEAELQSANALWVLAESDLRRAKSLLESKAIPQRDYDQRRNAAEAAKANLTRARLNLEYTHIKSPINGRASRAEITLGNLVSSGSSAPLLTTIVSKTPIYADFEIDEASFLKYTSAGVIGNEKVTKIPVTLSVGKISRDGHVDSFDNRVDSTSGTVRVRAVFDNEDNALVPGLFARVKIGSPVNVKAVLITDRAVLTDQDRKFVLVIGENNQAERRYITLGGVAEGMRIVEDGLKVGEKIIVSGVQRVIMPNQPVKPELIPMDGELPPESQPQPETDAVKE